MASQTGRFEPACRLADLARLGTTLGSRVLARTKSERKLLTGVVRPLFALLQAA